MCGILGSISTKDVDFNKGLEILEHRGPDASGIFEYNNVKLGHRRLSIIDLDQASNQPFQIEGHTLVFNGEIYNYLSLKEILLNEGVSFRTKSDTEVLLQWLIHKGIEKIDQVEGMYAFIWLNSNKDEVVVCRDAIGIKPLYIYQKDQTVFFSSEIKAIFGCFPEARQIDESLISEYLLNGFIYEPYTGFKDVRKLGQGCYEVYSIEGELLQKKKYWSLEQVEKVRNNQTQISEAIDQTIQYHLMADVPVGLFFSGGIDSSVILTQTKSHIKPITVKSEQSEYKASGVTSDYQYAKEIANIFNIELDEIPLNQSLKTNEDFLEAVANVAKGNEELMADFTYLSSKLLSLSARERGYIVMLSGMGADEIFGGYPRYKLVKYAKVFKWIKPFSPLLRKNKWLAKKIDRFLAFYNESDFALKYTSLIGVFSKEEVTELIGTDQGVKDFKQKMKELLSPMKGESDLRKSLYMDFYGFLAHNFIVADKSSMQASIEMRVSLATKSLYEMSWGMPDQQMLDFSHYKKPLRTYLLKYLPKRILDRKKAGFNPPLDGYIRNLGKDKTIQTLKENGMFDYIKQDPVLKIIQEHFTKRKNNTYKIYQFLFLSFWIKQNS